MKKKILSKLKQFEWFIQIGLLFLFLYLIATYAFSTNTDVFKEVFLKQVMSLENYYYKNPVLTTILILGSHLVVSFFSIPACAFINITCGYLLGFWTGAGAIYFITMLSAVLGYSTGRHFYDMKNQQNKKWFWLKLPVDLNDIRHRGLIYLVLIRLSPFLPFGLLNLSLGYSKAPFGVYFISTFVGVFFDVVLLNKIGASIHDFRKTSIDDYFFITGVFLLIFVLLIFSKIVAQLALKNIENKQKLPGIL